MHGCLSLIHARIHTNKLPITAQLIRNLRTQKWTKGGSYSRHPLRSLLNPSPSRFFLPPYPLLTPATRATPYKHFGSLCWVSSVKARQSEHARTLLARAQGSTFSALPQLGGGKPLSWNNLSSFKRAPRQLYSHLHSSVANSRRLEGWCLCLKTFTFLEVQHKTRVHRFLPLFSECLPSCPGS